MIPQTATAPNGVPPTEVLAGFPGIYLKDCADAQTAIMALSRNATNKSAERLVL
jgi:hypothetical protein